MRIEEKKRIVEDLSSRFVNADAVILADYKGLDVSSINLLRSRLREVGVEFQVVKNSLLIRASNGTSVELIKNEFKGPSVIALCYGDPIGPAKVLSSFSSEYDGLKIKIGLLGDRTLSVSDIKLLASLSSRTDLLKQLLFSMAAVPTSLVTALSGVTLSFVNVLQAIRDQKEA